MLLFIGFTGEWSKERDPVIYEGHWRSAFVVLSPLFDSIPGLFLFPWQLMLLAMVPVCLAVRGARAPELDAAIVISLASIAVTFMWGFVRGGSAHMAYYQTWRFMAGLMLALMLQSAIKTPRDLKWLAYTIVLAAIVRAGLAEYFYWMVVREWGIKPIYMTTHDDSLLFVAAILIVLIWAGIKHGTKTWLLSLLICAHVGYAMVLNNRRLAWIELLLAFGLIFFVLPKPTRKRWLKFTPVFLPVVLAYAAVGWGREEAIFAPLQAFSTAGSVNDNSSLARQEEIRNLIYTFTNSGNPLFGTGWGIPYAQVTSIYTYFEGGFAMYPYLPHNSLLGIAAFAGFVGIFGIWLVIPVSALLGMQGLRGASNPVSRAAAMTVLGFLPAYGAQCYGDIGFQGFTCALLIGCAAGVSGKLSVWAASARRRARPIEQVPKRALFVGTGALRQRR